LSSDNILLYGSDFITEYIDDLKFKIYPNSFFQVNYTQMEKMYQKALDYAQIRKDDVVYDLYCGIGSISLLLAKRAKYVYGIEVVPQSIISAKENAKENNIDNIEFICGKVENEIKKLTKKAKSPDIIVLDPARKGCDPIVLDTILSVSPRKIIYISCNTSTLARDLKILLENAKYTLEEVTPFDLFCHSCAIPHLIISSCKKYNICFCIFYFYTFFLRIWIKFYSRSISILKRNCSLCHHWNHLIFYKSPKI